MATTGSTCPSCSAPVMEGAKFCVSCGKAVSGPSQCQKCHADLPPGAKFCVSCGTRVLPGVSPIQRIERAVSGGAVSAADDIDDGNRWRRRPGDFARRFETGDLSALLAKGIVVEEGTRGLLFQDGQYMGDLNPGHYTVQSFTERLKNLVVKRPCTIVLVDIGDVPVSVQFDGLRTSDDQQVGAELQFVIGLRDAMDLYVNLMHGEARITADELAARLQNQLLRPMRAAVVDCSVEELYGNRELIDRIEDELRDELQRSFDRFGLQFERVDFVDFKGDPYEQVRELRGGLRRDTALAEVNEQRAKLKERFRQAFNEDAMNKVRSKQDFEEFLAQVEQDAGVRGLLRQQEREELWRQYEERKEDHALAREHVLATLDWQNKRERLARELDYKRDLITGRHELDDAQRNQRIKALELEHTAELARLEQTHASELSRLASQRTADLSHQAAEADEDYRQLEREAALGMRLQREWNETKHVSGQQEIERDLSRKRGEHEIVDAAAQAAHQRELEKWQALGTMSSEALIAAAPADQAKLLAELKQTEALKGMTEEQILASAAKDSPEVAKAFAEKFRAAGSQQTEMYERLLKEQKEAGNQLAETQRENAKLLREMWETSLQTQRDTAVAATQGTHGQPAIVYPPPGSGAAMVVGSQTPQQPGQSSVDCPQCRSQSPQGSQFCGNCGYRFA